jgi:hypothetical protein
LPVTTTPPTTAAALRSAVKRLTGLDCSVDVGVYGTQVVGHAQDRYRVCVSFRGTGPTLENAIGAVWEQVSRGREAQTVMPLEGV